MPGLGAGEKLDERSLCNEGDKGERFTRSSGKNPTETSVGSDIFLLYKLLLITLIGIMRDVCPEFGTIRANC
jgi:hypothetical protein